MPLFLGEAFERGVGHRVRRPCLERVLAGEHPGPPLRLGAEPAVLGEGNDQRPVLHAPLTLVRQHGSLQLAAQEVLPLGRRWERRSEGGL